MDYVIRPGRPGDVAAIAELQAAVQVQDMTGGEPHPGIAAWVEDLMDGHPTVRPEDFLVAESDDGRVAASLVVIRQEWSLAGVRLPVAVIELVGTLPEHRGNKLTDRLFEAVHRRLDADGVTLQLIEGIPYFYRRFGYDYALANDGAPSIPVAALPDGPSKMRPATVDDAEALAAADRELSRTGVLCCPRDAGSWRYEIAGRRPDDLIRRIVAVHEDGGYLVHTVSGAAVIAATVRPDDSVYAYLRQIAGPEQTKVRLLLGPDHPLSVLGPAGVPQRTRGWFVRTGDPAALIARLKPVLRARWQAAGLRWPGSTMTIESYGRAARLHFTDGLLTDVSTHRGEVSPAAAIPPGALLRLALGHRTLPEILAEWPDALPGDRITEHFLTTAFPRVPVHAWPVV
ncbi:MAG TPA: GNAT family N-acetyltransferase [Actinoplanes sp.]|nr:GNAT family N-acetyltransferase [Actinoplanes sp.]